MSRIKALVALILSLALVFPPNVMAEVIGAVTYIEGRVDRQSKDKTSYSPLVVGDKIDKGDILRTKSYSKAEITLADDSIVKMGDSTQIRLTDYAVDAKGSRTAGIIDLERGNVRAVVEKSLIKAPFDIKTPNALGSVKGSDIFVSYQQSATSVLVAEGLMTLSNPTMPGKTVNVKDGMTAAVPFEGAPVEPRAFLPQEKDKYVTLTGDMITGAKGKNESEFTKAVVKKVEGSVRVLPSNAKNWHVPVAGEVLSTGDKMETGKDGRLIISCDNGLVLDLRPETQLAITSLKRDPKTGDYENTFQADYGKIVSRLQNKPSASKFYIKTPQACCGIRGTIMYTFVLPKMTKVFFEGGHGYLDILDKATQQEVNNGQTLIVGEDGTLTGPFETTDEDRAPFGSQNGNEEYGYSNPGDGGDGDTGDQGGDEGQGQEGFQQGTGQDDDGGDLFTEVEPEPSQGQDNSGGTDTGNSGTVGQFAGNFGYYGSFEADENSSITGQLTTNTPDDAPWTGSYAVTLDGTCYNPEQRDVFFAEMTAVAADGGNMEGRLLGTTGEAGANGVFSGIYIDPSYVAGAYYGDFAADYLDTLDPSAEGSQNVLTGVGTVFYLPMAGTQYSPSDLPEAIMRDEYDTNTLARMDDSKGFFEVNETVQEMSIDPDWLWGAWNEIFQGEYANPDGSAEWISREIGGDIEDGYYFATFEGTDDLSGNVRIDVTERYMDYEVTGFEIGTYIGKYSGEGDVSDVTGIGAGFWQYEPLSLSARIDAAYNYFCEECGYLHNNGMAVGILGSVADVFAAGGEPVDLTIMGETSSGGGHTWCGTLNGNYAGDSELTGDGFIMGQTYSEEGAIGGQLVSLYEDEQGNVGILKGSFSGGYDRDSEMWMANGTYTAYSKGDDFYYYYGNGEVDSADIEGVFSEGYFSSTDGMICGGDIQDIASGYMGSSMKWFENMDWGVYGLELGGGYEGTLSDGWNMELSGSGWGANNKDWTGTITGTKWSNGILAGAFEGYYDMTNTDLLTISGAVYGSYGDGAWQAVSIGTYGDEVPLSFFSSVYANVNKADLRYGGYYYYSGPRSYSFEYNNSNTAGNNYKYDYYNGGYLYTYYYEDGTTYKNGYDYWNGQSYSEYGTWDPTTDSLAELCDNPMSGYYQAYKYENWDLNDFGSIDLKFGSTGSLWDGQESVILIGNASFRSDNGVWNAGLLSSNSFEENYTTFDGGAYKGYIGGSFSNGYINGKVISLYIDPTGRAGYMYGDVSANAEGSGEYVPFMGTGNVYLEEMGDALGISPDALYYSVSSGSASGERSEDSGFNADGEFYGGFQHGAVFSGQLGMSTMALVNYDDRISADWGIYSMQMLGKFTGPVRQGAWSALAGGEASFGRLFPANGGKNRDYDNGGRDANYGYYLGYLNGNIYGTDLSGEYSGTVLTRTWIGNIGGELLGNGDLSSGLWQGISFGTWQKETPLTFSGRWSGGGGSVYMNYDGELNEVAWESGLIGAATSPWDAPAEFMVMGEMSISNGSVTGATLNDENTYVYNSPISSDNAAIGNRTTIDGGAFAGYSAGIWQYGEVDGRVLAVYVDPSGNAGVLSGTVSGNSFDKIEMWRAYGVLEAEVIDTDLGISAEDFAYSIYYDSGAGKLSGSFDEYGDLTITGQDELRTTSITDDVNGRMADWGVYSQILWGAYYNPDLLTGWSAVMGGNDSFGIYYTSKEGNASYDYYIDGDYDGQFYYYYSESSGSVSYSRQSTGFNYSKSYSSDGTYQEWSYTSGGTSSYTSGTWDTDRPLYEQMDLTTPDADNAELNYKNDGWNSEHDNGYWIAEVGAENNIDGDAFQGTLSGRFLTGTKIGTLSGDIWGRYLWQFDSDGNDLWQGVGLGMWEKSADLSFSGQIAKNESDGYRGSVYSLYGYEGDGGIGYLSLGQSGHIWGMLGSEVSPWCEEAADVLMMGGLSLNGESSESQNLIDSPVWTADVRSYNVVKETCLTMDGGAFFGKILGKGDDSTDYGMNSMFGAIYMDPSGNTGILMGSLDGTYYEGIDLWDSEGSVYSVFEGDDLGLMPEDLVSSGSYSGNDNVWDSGDASGNLYLDGDSAFIHGVDRFSTTSFVNKETMEAANWGIYSHIIYGRIGVDSSDDVTFSAVMGGNDPIGATQAYQGSGYFTGDEGWWIADVSGVLPPVDEYGYGSLQADLSGHFITHHKVGHIQGDIMGNYDDGLFLAVGIGTWEGDDLMYTSDVDGGIYRFYDYSEGAGIEIVNAGSVEGILGGTDSLWTGELADVKFIGSYSYYGFEGDDTVRFWRSSLNSGFESPYGSPYSVNETYDGGEYQGYIMGYQYDDRMAGLIVASTRNPEGNIGLMVGGLDGRLGHMPVGYYDSNYDGLPDYRENYGMFIMDGDMYQLDLYDIMSLDVEAAWEALSTFDTGETPVELAIMGALGIDTDVDLGSIDWANLDGIDPSIFNDSYAVLGAMLGVGMSLYDSEEDNGGLWGAMAAGLTFGELPETVSVPFVGIVAADGFGSVIELLSGSDLSANDITFYMGEMRSSDWNADGKISGSFYGIFLQGTFEAGVNLGRLNGSFTGNSEYVELGEELNGQMWTAAMAGEWVEVDELLSLTELTSRVEEMSDMNIVTICDQAAIPGTGYGGLTTGTMDIGMYAMNESALTGIWAAFFSGAYDTGAAIGTTDWGMDFVTENANVALEGMQWNIIDETVGNGEWLATVSGQVDGNMIAGTAAGTFDGAGAFAGAGAGAWAAPEVVNAVETVVDPVAPDVN